MGMWTGMGIRVGAGIGAACAWYINSHHHSSTAVYYTSVTTLTTLLLTQYSARIATPAGCYELLRGHCWHTITNPQQNKTAHATLAWVTCDRDRPLSLADQASQLPAAVQYCAMVSGVGVGAHGALLGLDLYSAS